jgi:hypothetical protein
VDDSLLELGDALEVLGPRAGLSPSFVRRILCLQPQVLVLDELITLGATLHISLTDRSDKGDGSVLLATYEEIAEQPPASDVVPADASTEPTSKQRLDDDGASADTGGDAAPCWRVDARRLSRDLTLERRLLTYRSELAEQAANQSPELIHALRVAPFGPPPAPGSRYYGLFEYLDRQLIEQFVLPFEELRDLYEYPIPGLAGHARKVTLPRSARHQRGWWSNPKRNPDTNQYEGVGTQPQRVIWRAAGYETGQVKVQENPNASGPADRLIVTHITFKAIPGRTWWHPFRHQLRSGELSPWQRTAVLENVAKESGWEDARWFMRPMWIDRLRDPR